MANNQNVNKVVYGGSTLIDLTDTTAEASDVAAGKVFYAASGARMIGTRTEGGDSTPVGTVIYYAGKTAPGGYLACDGSVYNIADYPALAAFFAENYDAANYWGGDGETTFAVPDWQGEFFRASGTNSREHQGSGAAVGVHQDATEHMHVTIDPSDKTVGFEYTDSHGSTYPQSINNDAITATRDGVYVASVRRVVSKMSTAAYYAARPTNTSLLVCIKT